MQNWIQSIWSRHKLFIKIFFLALFGLAIFYYFALPTELFKNPTSTVIEDQHGNLLSARIAEDGQWRFPTIESVPEKFKYCLLYFEDQHFYHHFGFNPFSMVRAFWQNMRAGKVVSGGSTITMQVIRLSRKNKSRSLWEKLIEICLATRLEIRQNKNETLKMYATNAPFGGNIVGLETASWRYFGRQPNQLSWSESAALAVLPNQPGLIFPGKNQKILRQKRNNLLQKLYQAEIIDSLTFVLAIDEPLPSKPYPVPQLCNHLMDKAIDDGLAGKKIHSTIDLNLQEALNQIMLRHHRRLSNNEIYNAALMVMSVNTGNVLSYIGNVGNKTENGFQVDVIKAPRSSGSILKPLLYAAMIEGGQILPTSLLPDIPTVIDGFAPKNFSETYEGAVFANEALAKSLNIPAVLMLQDYGLEKFHFMLNNQGFSTIKKPPGHYGLSLILGGAETTLVDLCTVYANMARALKEHFLYPKDNNAAIRGPLDPNYLVNQTASEERKMHKVQQFDPATIWLIFEAMLEVYRPNEDASWKYYESAQKIAWKTGTSYGFRDGWAVGITPDYVVGVWVGNADGEGRPGLTGINTAGPILFDVFDQLPNHGWFNKPQSELIKIEICRQSGYKAGKYCPLTDQIDSHKSGNLTANCPYHHLIHLEKSENFQVSSNCESVQNMISKSWFVLPPIQAHYYRKKSAFYKSLPPFRADCKENFSINNPMQAIYPKNNSKIYIPTELNGKRGSVVLEVAHNDLNAAIYWHLDENYISTTRKIHKLELSPIPGEHQLTLFDQNGASLELNFKIIEKESGI